MTPFPDSFNRVRRALDALADALISGSPDDVLAVEEDLRQAVTSFRADALPQDVSAALVRQHLLGLRLRVQRCERLGTALSDLAPARASAAGYSRSGRAELVPAPALAAAAGGR